MIRPMAFCLDFNILIPILIYRDINVGECIRSFQHSTNFLIKSKFDFITIVLRCEQF